MTNHINLNFVNEIIKYIENNRFNQRSFNNIQENQKLNLKNDDKTKIINDNILPELKYNNDDRRDFSNKEKNGLINIDNKDNERFINSDEI